MDSNVTLCFSFIFTPLTSLVAREDRKSDFKRLDVTLTFGNTDKRVIDEFNITRIMVKLLENWQLKRILEKCYNKT